MKSGCTGHYLSLYWTPMHKILLFWVVSQINRVNFKNNYMLSPHNESFVFYLRLKCSNIECNKAKHIESVIILSDVSDNL